MVARRQQLQKLLDGTPEQAPGAEQRRQHYIQEKTVLTAKISRLNKQIDLHSAPAGMSRWVQFATFDQLRGVCDALLEEVLQKTQKLTRLTKENKQLEKEKKEVLSQRLDSV